MLKRFKGEFFTIPNLFTYARVILIPIIVWTYCKLEMYRLSALLVALSGITDCADGFIARKYNMITDFGKIIDPIADKLTQITVIACLTYRFRLMIVLVALLVVKELCVGIMGLAVVRTTDVVEGSRWYGKAATILFYFIIVLLLAVPMPEWTSNLLIFCCLAGMTLSLILYVVRYASILSKFKK
ncbi:MAG: CDP-alcohol phosphatidyltransferase family protein [Eubacteriales bacterium]